MYNQGNINLTYDNGTLSVEFKNLSGDNISKFKIYNGQEKHENSTDKYTGEVKPSCEGYITFADNEKGTFEFNEENKEIVWTGPDGREKWIRG